MSRSHFVVTAFASGVLIASVAVALASSRRNHATSPGPPGEWIETASSFDPPPPPPAAAAETEIMLAPIRIVGQGPTHRATRLDCGEWQSLTQGPGTQRVRTCRNVYR